MKVTETFFSIDVIDMKRATAFYVDAFGARVSAALPFWSSLHVAGVRIGLFLHPQHSPGRIGLHFVVDDLAEACEGVVRAGGRIVEAPREVAPNVIVADVADTEGNVIAVRGP